MENMLNILIVEDSESDLELVVRILKKNGILNKYLCVETRDKYREALKTNSFDVILADYRLPQFDAPEALEILKKSGLDIPFIVVTGTVGEEIVVELMKKGAHDYLLKNKLTRLVEVIRREVSESKIRLKQKQVEEALCKSEKKYKNIIDHSPVGIYQSTSKGDIIFANNRLALILGYESSDDLYRLNFAKDIYYDSSDRSKMLSQIKMGTEQKEYELKWKMKNGTPIWILNSLQIIKDKNGNISSFEGFVTDISLRKKNEENLLILSTAVEQSSASIVITDREGNIEYVNQMFTEITGYSFREAKGNNPRILKSGIHSKEFYENLWSTVLSKKNWRGEIQNKKKNGDLYWENALISPIVNRIGTITHFVALKEDITEKKNIIKELVAAKEKAEEMNKVKSNFFANMSHELRTPFVCIMGYAEMLAEMLTNSEEKEIANGIIKASERLTDTLNKILSITKLESDKIDMELKKVDVINIINEVYKDFVIVSEKKNITFRKKLKFESLIMLTDEYMFRGMLNNLLNNAVTYTNKGWIEISVEKQITVDNNLLVIKIQDTGIGIPKEKQSIIWEAFRQASEGTTKIYQGTGLGLAITKKYTQLIGGTIFMESELGKGSIFTIKLPY